MKLARRLLLGLLIVVLAGFFTPVGRAGEALELDESQSSSTSETATEGETAGTEGETAGTDGETAEGDEGSEETNEVPSSPDEGGAREEPAPPPETEETDPPAETPAEGEETDPPAETPAESEETVPPPETPAENEETVPPAEVPAESPPAETPIEPLPESPPPATPPEAPPVNPAPEAGASRVRALTLSLSPLVAESRLLREADGCLSSAPVPGTAPDHVTEPVRAAAETQPEAGAADERPPGASFPKHSPGKQPSSGASTVPAAGACGTGFALSVEVRLPVPVLRAYSLRSSFASPHSLVVASRLERPG